MWHHHHRRASPPSRCVCVCVYLTFLSFLVFASTSCCSEENVSLSSSVSSSWANICCCISLSLRVCRHTQMHTLSYVLYTSTYGCWRWSVLFFVWPVIANIKTVCVTCSAISCFFCSSIFCCSLVWSIMFFPPTSSLLSIAWQPQETINISSRSHVEVKSLQLLLYKDNYNDYRYFSPILYTILFKSFINFLVLVFLNISFELFSTLLILIPKQFKYNKCNSQKKKKKCKTLRQILSTQTEVINFFIFFILVLVILLWVLFYF